MQNDHPLISSGALEARGAWGFVGVVRVGDHEAFRTLRSCAHRSGPDGAGCGAAMVLRARREEGVDHGCGLVVAACRTPR